MNGDTFNMDVRKFLKAMGVTSQCEIKHAVQNALVAGKLKGNERLSAKVVPTVDGLDLAHEVKGEIALQ
ncbi:MAG TPA: DUF6494 family protein [Azospirillum sp.]|nr:DUF6494 family protein [Azospirillum sp.]